MRNREAGGRQIGRFRSVKVRPPRVRTGAVWRDRNVKDEMSVL